jgi:phospholipid transport system substrate-binding protein
MKSPYEKNVNNFVIVFILLSIIISSLALAENISPEEKVKAVFSQIESSLISLKAINQLTKNNIREVLNQYLLPEVNTHYFSNKVLNKNLVKVSEKLKEAFVTELSIQLIDTYSHLLSKYNNESIHVGMSSLSKSGKIAMVNITIVGKNNTNKAVLKLIKLKEEAWLFYDIVVEGISLLDTKQKEINASFSRVGAEGTLLQIRSINQRS